MLPNYTLPTHNVISLPDGVFSLVTACLNAEHDIQTPRDIQRTEFFTSHDAKKLVTELTLNILKN